jgi:hypothetical protein
VKRPLPRPRRGGPWWALAFIPIAAPAGADGQWNADLFLGAAAPLSTTLEVRQEGEPTLSFDADWDARSFDPPLYYAWRVARWSKGRAWTLGLVHLKLHLANPPPEIQSFAVSHGYNLLTLGRLWSRGAWHLGASAGAVVAHPENTVRGRSHPENRGLLNDGYYFAGPAGEALLGWRRTLADWVALSLEGRLSVAHARVEVEGGSADVPSIALHGLVGFSLGPRPRPAGP